MTWDEFKAEVDRQLEEQGYDGKAEIWYIDLSYPDEDDKPYVFVDDIQGMSIH